MKRVFMITVALLINSGCAFRSVTDSIESVYTDEVVVEPTSKNYKSAPKNSTKPILRDEVVQKSQDEIDKAQSARVKKVGHITSSSFDKDINLYVYNFSTTDTGEELVFFYDTKLPYGKNDLIEVDIKDNFLMSYNSKNGVGSAKSLTITQKKKRLKKRRKNLKIREAVEEKINTF